VKPTLDSLEQFGWRFGLETTRALLARLGNPQDKLQFVHVAGSNGKGSTSAFTASFLEHAGYKTGLYTSPHLSDIRERFRINGEWIPQADFRRHTREVLAVCQSVRKKLGHSPTHFEALTAIALCWFREQKADWVVLETGLGGRLDATNIIQYPATCLITPIGLEHQNVLGKTLAKIAREKAGIFKPGCFAATVQPRSEALRVIEREARKKEVELWRGGREFHFTPRRGGFHWEGPGLTRTFRIPGMPDYQVGNAALAVAGIQQLRVQKAAGTERTIQAALSAMRFPGRMEVLGRKPLILLDGAHNPEGARALSAHLRRHYPGKRWIVLNGFLADKDHASFVKSFAPMTDLSIVTEPQSGRAERAVRVQLDWEREGVRSLCVADWEQAIDLALSSSKKSGTPLLITGSLYLAGDCRKKLVGLRGLEKI
jgi:dihydrofolate synthase/folylpolyglutamate synthase